MRKFLLIFFILLPIAVLGNQDGICLNTQQERINELNKLLPLVQKLIEERVIPPLFIIKANPEIENEMYGEISSENWPSLFESDQLSLITKHRWLGRYFGKDYLGHSCLVNEEGFQSMVPEICKVFINGQEPICEPSVALNY